MGNYYSEKLNSSKLVEVYQTKIERVKQYFFHEINFVGDRLTGKEEVLELGAGYGRIMKELAPLVKSMIGIDISADSVLLGREYLREYPNCMMEMMDVYQMAFEADFDVVLCLQNGLSAFKGKDEELVRRAMDVLKPGGVAYFSSYSEKFWDHRLAWFQEQSGKGLLGEIDWASTKDGEIVCFDGFRAITTTPEDMRRLGEMTGCSYQIEEVDESSIFLVIHKNN